MQLLEELHQNSIKTLAIRDCGKPPKNLSVCTVGNSAETRNKYRTEATPMCFVLRT